MHRNHSFALIKKHWIGSSKGKHRDETPSYTYSIHEFDVCCSKIAFFYRRWHEGNWEHYELCLDSFPLKSLLILKICRLYECYLQTNHFLVVNVFGSMSTKTERRTIKINKMKNEMEKWWWWSGRKVKQWAQ